MKPVDRSPRPRRHPRLRFASKKSLRRVGLLLLAAWWWLIRMPGSPHRGPLPPLTDTQARTADRLRADVELLAGEHPQRHAFNPLRYAAAADAIRQRFIECGYTPVDEAFDIGSPHQCRNIIAEREGTTHPDEWIVVGAHYDAYMETPGADDNASGVACVLALAERFAEAPRARSIRWVLFANEEPPHFMTDDMGSHHHAQALRQRGERVILMMSLEMLGYYDDAGTPGHVRFRWAAL